MKSNLAKEAFGQFRATIMTDKTLKGNENNKAIEYSGKVLFFKLNLSSHMSFVKE